MAVVVLTAPREAWQTGVDLYARVRMAENKTVYGAKAEKLAALLGMGAESPRGADARSAAQRKADQLYDLLAAKSPLDGCAAETSTPPGPGFLRTLTSVLSESIEHHLMREETDIATLRQIKDYGAQLSRTASSPVEQEPANVVYYAAIAGALIHHNTRITKFSLAELNRALSRLATLSWLTCTLRQIFENACSVCRTLPNQHPSDGQP